MDKLKVSVVVPVYNDKGTIGEIYKRIKAVDFDKEIVFADDYSIDGTREIITGFASDDTQDLFPLTKI